MANNASTIFKHIPVLFEECLAGLDVKDGGVYFDGTLGGGGHTQGILDSADCRVVATDKDEDAIAHTTVRLSAYADRLTIKNSDFVFAGDVLDECGIDKLDGAILDLGISSYQIDTPERGFSYRLDGPLDMRMDKTCRVSAHDIVNTYSETDIVRILKVYGEERFAKRIVQGILRERAISPIATTKRLADIVKASVPFVQGQGHPAKKTFMALRIAVNNELEHLDRAIRDIIGRIRSGGRICIIAFHSLEDRIVKNVFKELATGCICDKRLPICVCGHKADIINLGFKLPSDIEIMTNSRAQSAILRIAKKL